MILTGGCADIPVVSYTPLSGGFSIKNIDYVPGIDRGGGRELHFKSSNKKQILVWKYVPGVIVAHHSSAIFIGDIRNQNSQGPSYFLVESNRPVVNVEKEILKLYADRDMKDLSQLFKNYSTYQMRELKTGVELEYGPEFGVGTPHLFVQVTWTELSQMYEEALAGGTQHKDLASGLTYIERELRP